MGARKEARGRLQSGTYQFPLNRHGEKVPRFSPARPNWRERQPGEKACSEVFSRRLMRLGTNEALDLLIKTNSLDEIAVESSRMSALEISSSKNVKVEV